jgi:HD-like signal output (HDOD) protein
MTSSLPPFPAVAQKILELTGNGACPINDVARLVRTDAAFSAEVLRLANSAVLGLRFEVVNILQAVSLLGTARLNSLVLTIAVRDLVRDVRTNEALRLAWRHNFATALAAEWIAEPCGFERAAGYTYGLLHELGRLAMVLTFGYRYDAVLSRAARTDEDLEALERMALGVDHCQVGRWLAEHWCLPPKMTEAIASRRPAPGGEFGVAHLSSLGCELADRAGFTVSGAAAEWDLAVLDANLPPAALAVLKPMAQELRESLQQKVRLFESSFMVK